MTATLEMTLPELRAEWARLHGNPPQSDLGRDLLARGISYKLQEQKIQCPLPCAANSFASRASSNDPAISTSNASRRSRSAPAWCANGTAVPAL